MFNKTFICIICFFTINLYNFILCILNDFLKTYLKIITECLTDRLYPSTLDTNEFTDGTSPSAFHSSWHNHRRIYRRISSIGISHTHQQRYRQLISSVFHIIIDRIRLSVYFKRETFFLARNCRL